MRASRRESGFCLGKVLGVMQIRHTHASVLIQAPGVQAFNFPGVQDLLGF